MTPSELRFPVDLPVLGAAPAPGARIFQDPSDVPLLVSCNCPTTLCNYRCSYCYLDHDARDGAREGRALRVWERIVDRIAEIRRPLFLAIGTQGEPLTVKPFWDVLRRLSALEHVRGFWFPTNLSRPIEHLAEGVDIAKLGLTASLHPSEFRNHDRDLEAFLSRCEWVRERGGDVVINFILTPDQFGLFPAYRWIARERGLPMTANVFKGVYQGRSYPESYTKDDHARIEEFFADRPLVHDFMSGRSSRGVACNAGRDLLHVDEATGAVWNCPFALEPMGSIFDDELAVRTSASPCSTDWCKCHWTIGMIEEMTQRFRRTKSILNYEPREELTPGARPFA
ncbi:MAG: radical SAM protein [Planctomycetes bacterium]|nr:radical SAM protein [Planctomycetota bacterium]